MLNLHHRTLTAPPRATPTRLPVARAWPESERNPALAEIRALRFADQTPTEVDATLLDEGMYRCSIRTMYRILAAHGEVAERRRQRRHSVYQRPELLAEGPNHVWSWDITKLMGPVNMGPVKWSCFYLCVILDIFGRRVTGWRIEHTESASQFKALVKDAMAKHAVPPDQLTLHADRGAAMKAKATALMLADPGVVKSHSRPHISNDNPFRAFVNRQVVQDDRVALLQRGCELSFDASIKQVADDRAIDHPRGVQPVVAQGCDEELART